MITNFNGSVLMFPKPVMIAIKSTTHPNVFKSRNHEQTKEEEEGKEKDLRRLQTSLSDPCAQREAVHLECFSEVFALV